jgi:hypothetical protein
MDKKTKKQIILSKLKERIKSLVKKEMDEASVTGGVAAIQTPYAFSAKRTGDTKKDMGNLKAATTSTGYTKVKEENEQPAQKQEPVNQTTPAPIQPPVNPPQPKRRNVNKDDLSILIKKKNNAQKNGNSREVAHYDALIGATQKILKSMTSPVDPNIKK